MTETPSELPGVPPEMGQRLLEQTFELWLKPEIERRSQMGSLPQGFRLHSAQVLFDLDAEAPRVRINNEVRALASVRITTAVKAGDPVMSDEVDDFHHIELTDEDPNAAHITMIRLRDHWAISFNFRYNAQRVRDTIKLAEEFLEAARYAIEKGHLRAALDNLYSSVELLAKASLLPTPPKAVWSGKTHGSIQAHFNRDAKRGNADKEFAKLLNRLAGLRPSARYLDGPLKVDEAETRKMFSKTEDMLRAVQARAPRRRLSEGKTAQTDDQ